MIGNSIDNDLDISFDQQFFNVSASCKREAKSKAPKLSSQ